MDAQVILAWVGLSIDGVSGPGPEHCWSPVSRADDRSAEKPWKEARVKEGD
jgi:hypothetical protein